MIDEILTRDYGWVFAIAVVVISMGAILYGLPVISEIRADLKALRAEGKNGILVGLTLVSFKLHILRLAQLSLFATAGWIVLGVVIAGAPPEGLLLSFSRSVTLSNVCLTAGALVWGQMARRDLASREAERQRQALAPEAAARVLVTAKDTHEAAVVVEAKAAEAVVVAEDEVRQASERPE